MEESGTITGIICHIRARKRGGPRFDAKQTEEQRHAFENLLLLCARHSKVIDSEPSFYTVKKLGQLKAAHEQPAENELSVGDGKKVDLLLADYRTLYITAREVAVQHIGKAVFPRSKGPTIAAPDDAIGSDLPRRNYVQHLIDQYNDFASKQPGRKKFAFAAIYSLIKKRYGVRKWELVPLARFGDLCELLQGRIDATWLGSVNRGKRQRNYSTFDEYRVKYFEGGPK